MNADVKKVGEILLMVILPLGLLIVVFFLLHWAFQGTQPTQSEATKPNPQQEHQWYIRTCIHYVKDERTGLCFAGADGYNNTFTNVPCSPEVEKLLTPTLR